MSGTSIEKYNFQQKKPTAKPAIDTCNDNPPPLDYSFLKLSAVQEICDEEPRVYSLKKGAASPRVDKDNKSKSQCIRINNNQLTDIKLMKDVVSDLFTNPLAISWIDLSFNELTCIDPVLKQFENLKILYLHGNCICNLKEVNELQDLKQLRKLTLHGNPIEETPDYKHYVLSHLPELKCLDFIQVTKGDRITVKSGIKTCSKSSKKKGRKDD